MKSDPRAIMGPYLRPHRKQVALIVMLTVLGVAAQVTSIFMLKPILDEGVYGNDMANILYLGSILIVMTVLYSAVTAYTSYLSSKIASSISHSIRKDIVTSILEAQRLDSKNSTTNAMTCLTTDVDSIQKYILEGLRTYLPMPFLILALLACTYYISTVVGVMLTVTFILVVGITYLLSRRISKYYDKQLKAIDDVNSQLRQKVTGARTIRAYNGYDYETEKFLGYSKTLGSFNSKIVLNSHYIPHLMSAIIWMAIVFIYMYTALDSYNQTIIPTELVLFMQYTAYFIATLAIIPYLGIETPKAYASSARISDLINSTKHEDRQLITGNDDEAVIVKGLTMLNSMGMKSLNDVDLTIHKGETVSVVGPNGCGGYDLAMTMMGFNRHVTGQVNVCGIDVLSSNPEHIRSKISYTSSSIAVINGTLRYNLDPHRLNTDEEILAVCDRLGIKDYIDSLPEGLDSHVADDKSSISGGQKQLILIARSLLKHSELYIFENCFYSIDPQRRETALSLIKEMCENATVIFIMNDTWTCKKSSRIIMMNHGEVCGMGVHDELIRNSQLYKDMYSAGQRREGTWA